MCGYKNFSESTLWDLKLNIILIINKIVAKIFGFIVDYA